MADLINDSAWDGRLFCSETCAVSKYSLKRVINPLKDGIVIWLYAIHTWIDSKCGQNYNFESFSLNWNTIIYFYYIFSLWNRYANRNTLTNSTVREVCLFGPFIALTVLMHSAFTVCINVSLTVSIFIKALRQSTRKFKCCSKSRPNATCSRFTEGNIEYRRY